MNKEILTEKIKEGFKNNLFVLKNDEIISHNCDECNILKKDFSDIKHLKLPNDLIEEHCTDLPLLTPKAFHYFFPNYLIYSLSNLDWSICDFILNIIKDYNTSFYNTRFKLFNEKEKFVIKLFLLFIKDSDNYKDYKDLKEEVDSSIKNWKIEE